MEKIADLLKKRDEIKAKLDKSISDLPCPFKKGMVIVNPQYSPELDNRPNAESWWMLCVIADIFPHGQRRGKVAFRLETIKSRDFITNASMPQIIKCNSFLFG